MVGELNDWYWLAGCLVRAVYCEGVDRLVMVLNDWFWLVGTDWLAWTYQNIHQLCWRGLGESLADRYWSLKCIKSFVWLVLDFRKLGCFIWLVLDVREKKMWLFLTDSHILTGSIETLCEFVCASVWHLSSCLSVCPPRSIRLSTHWSGPAGCRRSRRAAGWCRRHPCESWRAAARCCLPRRWSTSRGPADGYGCRSGIRCGGWGHRDCRSGRRSPSGVEWNREGRYRILLGLPGGVQTLKEMETP